MECPACRASVPDGSRFCPSCGHALTTRAEERRVVTVLFADLVGFTGLSEGVDPEQLKNLVDAAFQRLVADISNHGGRVDKIVGDQIIALFGAPTAHEDDAERAVRAGLQMQRTLSEYAAETGIPVQMRIGINTGEVLVGALRAGGEYTAMGDTVNVASRLQTTAAPGQVLVGPVTHAQTSEVVRYEAIGAVQARGREEPVEAFAAEITLAPPGHRRRRSRTPLVGRDLEMAILCSTLSMAFERKRPQFIVLSGEAGVGKSRLAEELTQTAISEHCATVLEGRCVPYGEANVWWPMAGAIRQAFGIDNEDTADQAQVKVRSRASWGLGLPEDHPDVQRATDGLSYLLGITSSLTDLEPSRAREGAVRSLVGLFQNLARKKPLVLAVSELHWADELILDLLDQLPDRMRGLPFVIVATAGPELEQRWTPKAGRQNLVALHVDPLDRAAAESLLNSLLEGSASKELTNAVLDRSGGNPFFLEELAGLVHQAGSPGELPATLRALVATRLDSMPAAERRVLDHAAVVGRLGAVDALAALGGPDGSLRHNLDALMARDILSVDGNEWMFRSDLVREVAYETLTKSERARHHAQLGAFLREQARGTGREAEHLEALAHHFGVAAELIAELGHVDGLGREVVDDALMWIDRSITQAEHREISAEAERWCSRALAMVGDDDERRARFLVRRARARTILRNLDGARSDISDALEIAKTAGDKRAVAAALSARGFVEQVEGALHESAANLDDAISLWQEVGDRAGEADARRLRGMTELFLGHLPTAESNIAEALELYKSLDDRRGQAWAQQNMAWISTSGGDTEEATRRIAESVRLFEEIGDIAGLGWAYGLLGWVRLQQGYIDEADELAQRVMTSYESGGDRWASAMMRLLLASTRLWLGKTDEAVRYANEARERFVSINDSTGELRAVATLARAELAAGNLKRSREMMAGAVAMAERELDPDGRTLGRLIAAGTAIQLGEAGRMFDIGELLEPPSPATAPGPDREVPRATALLQLGRAELATTVLEGVFSRASDVGLQQAAGSTLALAHVTAGDVHSARTVADHVDALEQGTYLDHINVSFARGFAFVRERSVDDARRELEHAVALADGTGDRLNQALTRLAQARGLEALGDPAAPEILDDAETRLAELGLDDTDWDGVFKQAAGISS